MNAQEIFEKVATHLFTQGCQSKNSKKGCCLYRDDSGRSCGVGCLIPDELYQPAMDNFEDGNAIDSIMSNEYFTFPSYFKDNVDMLLDLQRCHDIDINWRSTEIMRSQLRVIAYSYDLDDDILNNLKFNDR